MAKPTPDDENEDDVIFEPEDEKPRRRRDRKDREAKDREAKDREAKDREPRDRKSRDRKSRDSKSRDRRSRDRKPQDSKPKDPRPKEREPKDLEEEDFGTEDPPENEDGFQLAAEDENDKDGEEDKDDSGFTLGEGDIDQAEDDEGGFSLGEGAKGKDEEDEDFSLAADIGPDVDLDRKTGFGTVDSGKASLEYKALAFARLGVDLVHDAVPPAISSMSPLGEEVLALRLHGRAEGIMRFRREVKVKVAGRVDAEASLDSNYNVPTERYEGQIWDTHLDLYLSHLDLRIGKQFEIWGASEILNPLDIINPRDRRRGLLNEPEELRLPVMATKATLYGGPVSLSGIWVPIAPVHRFELLRSDYSLLGPNAATSLERRLGNILSQLEDDPNFAVPLGPLYAVGTEPEAQLSSGELGAKLALRFSKVDLMGYGFWGRTRTPRIILAPELVALLEEGDPEELDADELVQRVGQIYSMGGTIVTVDYPRETTVGASIATRLEPIGVKLDAAFTPNAFVAMSPPGGSVVTTEVQNRDRVATTLSIDYNRGERFSFVGEINHNRILEVPPGLEVYGMRGRSQTVVGSSMKWTSSQGLFSMGLLGFVELNDEPGWAMRPNLELSGHDQLSIDFALRLQDGPPTSFGGLAERYNEAQITIRYGL